MKKIKAYMAQNNLILIPLISAVIGQVFLYYLKQAVPGLIFFAVAAALFIIHDRRNQIKTEIQIPVKTEIILFSIILLISALFRLVLINHVPAGCYPDEAAIGAYAKGILEHGIQKGSLLPIVLSGHTHHPSIVVYPAALVFKLFGPGATQLRVVSAIIGIFAVPAFYFLIRRIMGALPALAGAYLLAVMRWHVNFSRIGYDTVFSVTLIILALYFVFRAYKDKKLLDFIFAGITVAGSQYSYVSARLIFAWLAIIGVYIAVRDKEFYIENYKKIILMALTALVLLLPLIGHFLKKPEDLLQRTKEVALLDESVVKGYWNGKIGMAAALGETALKTAGMFNFHGDNNARHNLPGQPMVDFLTGMAALMGFIYALYRIRSPEYFFFTSFFAVFLLPGLITIEAPQALRTMTAALAVIFFAVVYIKKLAEGLKAKSVFVTAALSLALMAAGVENAYIYFGPQAHDPSCRAEFSLDEFELGEYMKNTGPGWHGIVGNDILLNGGTTYFIAGDRVKNCEIYQRDNPFPEKQGEEKDTYYIIERRFAPAAAAFKEIFPHAVVDLPKDPFSGDEYWFVGIKVPKQDIVEWNKESEKHGLTGRYYAGTEWKGTPLYKEKRQLFVCEWKAQPVAPPSSVEWTGRLRVDVPGGGYSFAVQSRNYTELYIDGKMIVENQGLATQDYNIKPEKGIILLNKGYHTVKLRQKVKESYYSLALWWIPPGETKKKIISPGVLYY